MAKNAYGQESYIEDMAQHVNRSNTHSDFPIQESPESAPKLPKETDRTEDPEIG